MGRREVREQIFKLLFRIEFNNSEEMQEQVKLFFQDDEVSFSQKEEAYISQKYENIAAKKEEIDKALDEISESWRTVRMGKVDLTILRLAVYEIRYDEDIPTPVAINEAVELAKKFGQDGSSSFVNGILARFA